MTLSREHELRLIDYAIEHLLGNIPKSTDPSLKVIRSATNVRKVKKSKHTKASRAAISKRMKAYWAKRRKQ